MPAEKNPVKSSALSALFFLLGGCTGHSVLREPATQANSSLVSEYGKVVFMTSKTNYITQLFTKLIVPERPLATGTVFLWPGLDPFGANMLPIDNGVLQSVLTWGPSCAPGKQPTPYSTWWVSAQYVNTVGSSPGYTGCQGGEIMAVSPGDVLDITISNHGGIWYQVVANEQTRKIVEFSIDLKKQAQNIAYFQMEIYNHARIYADVIFSHTTISFAHPDPNNCDIHSRGVNDFVTKPILIENGKQCRIEKIVLRSADDPNR